MLRHRSVASTKECYRSVQVEGSKVSQSAVNFAPASGDDGERITFTFYYTSQSKGLTCTARNSD